MTKNPMNCNNLVNYKSLINYANFRLLKIIIKVIISLITRGFTIYVNIIREITR